MGFYGCIGPNSDRERCLVWEELVDLNSWRNLPWCVGEDFNLVQFPSERLGAESFTQGMHNFSDFISNHGLMDIPLKGGFYTGSNSSSGSRTDHFIFSHHWEEHLPHISQRRLSRILTDHFPIMLEGGSQHKRQIPFRFENMWLQAEGLWRK